jgi:hypothetical protein
VLSLEFLIWALLIASLIAFWWQSDKVKHLALQLVARHCQQQGLQLLDQTMVLKGLRLARSNDGRLQLRRRYEFEFASTGSERYQGKIILAGLQIEELELAAHLLPESEQIH